MLSSTIIHGNMDNMIRILFIKSKLCEDTRMTSFKSVSGSLIRHIQKQSKETKVILKVDLYSKKEDKCLYLRVLEKPSVWHECHPVVTLKTSSVTWGNWSFSLFAHWLCCYVTIQSHLHRLLRLQVHFQRPQNGRRENSSPHFYHSLKNKLETEHTRPYLNWPLVFCIHMTTVVFILNASCEAIICMHSHTWTHL